MGEEREAEGGRVRKTGVSTRKDLASSRLSISAEGIVRIRLWSVHRQDGINFVA